MFGDNMETDIKFGKNVGIDTALVLTGVTRLINQPAIDQVKGNMPTYILKNMGTTLKNHRLE